MNRNQKGYMLPVMLMIIFIVTLLITAFWRYSMSDMEFAKREKRRLESYYLASSAVNLIADLNKDPGTYTLELNLDGKSHVITIDVTGENDIKTVTSSLNGNTLQLEMYKGIKYWRK